MTAAEEAFENALWVDRDNAMATRDSLSSTRSWATHSMPIDIGNDIWNWRKSSPESATGWRRSVGVEHSDTGLVNIGIVGESG